jgi:Xaa-Pro aminopeptidase
VELERRWAATRKMLQSREVDAIVVQGQNNVNGGGNYVRWLTGSSAYSTQPQIVIFPADGLMTIIGHGPAGQVTELSGKSQDNRGVERICSTPSFPSISYTGRYDAELLVQQIKMNGFRRVGMVGWNSAYYGPMSLAKEALGSVMDCDLTDDIDHLMAIKSPEEIDYIRQTAQVQDAVFAKVCEFIKVGMHDYEVMAYAQYQGQLHGSETGYYLGCSASPGQPLGHRNTPQQGRKIREGDAFMWQAETTGPGGYFVHICRLINFGKTPAGLAEMYTKMVEAQDFTRRLLTPGASCPEIFATYNAYMMDRGLQEELRLHCHGQGYTSVERPLIRHDESMRIAANMNIGIHPSHSTKEMFITLSDNFLTHEDGTVERLHKTPPDIVEL